MVLMAAKDNDAEMMEMLLASGMPATATNKIGQTGLHVVAIWGNMEVAMVLLRNGANVNARNQFGIAPLHMAAQSSQYALAKMLIEAKADTQLKASNGMKPYEAAKEDAMRKLCGQPELKAHEAVIATDTAALKALLSNGVDLSEQDPDGETPLHLAVKAALGDVLRSASVDVPLIEEEPSRACFDLIIGAAKTAWGFVASQHLHNEQGQMPLHIAASRGSFPICEALLAADAPVNACALRRDETHNGQWGKKSKDGTIERLDTTDQTALHYAVSLLAEQAEDDGEPTGDAALVRLLLKHGADANVPNLEQQTALHIAIMGGLHDVVEILIEAGADLQRSCKDFGKDNTALHQAVILRDVPMVKLLARHGAHVNAFGRDGWTPLGLAVRSGALATAKALLEAKADVSVPSGNGKTALEIATINKKVELCELLQAVQLD